MKLSVCLNSIFPQGDVRQSLRTIHRLGYRAFEFWGWETMDLNTLAEEKDALGLEVATFCTRFTSLVDPAQRQSNLAGLRESLPVAKRLGCRQLITQCGGDTGAPRSRQLQTMVEGLRQMAPLLEEAGVTLLLEPLNLMDHPGYFLVSSREAAEVLAAVGSPYVKMLFDIYHQQISEGDVLRNIERYRELIGHLHAAGNPGRCELGSGELHYGNIIRAIDRLGYQGYMGLEYFCREPVEQGLAHALSLTNTQAPTMEN